MLGLFSQHGRDPDMSPSQLPTTLNYETTNLANNRLAENRPRQKISLLSL